MKKATFSLLLVLMTLIGLLPVTARAEMPDNGLMYRIYEDHVEIIGYTGDSANLVIPDQIEGKYVTAIRSGAFSGCSGLTNVTIPDTVTSIGSIAFQDCSSLTSITIPNSVTSIGAGAFRGCSGLVNITISDSVTSIYTDTFLGCFSLACITIPDRVTSIGDYAFCHCNSLTAITIPDSVSDIGPSAFMYCYSLTDIDIPDSITYIDTNVFYSCENLTSITIPDGVKMIDNSAFANCKGLTSICFRGNAPRFGEDVFSGDNYSYNQGCVTATAYYPADNDTWTSDVMQDYGGDITWVPYYPNPFTDVPESEFYYEPVLWAVEEGITSGMTPTTFEPGTTCTRAQVVTFLWRAAGCPEPKSTEHPFKDVTEDYYYKAMLWAVEEGITNGMSTETFAPGATCTRGQVVTFLWRAAGKPTPQKTEHPFEDVTKDYYYDAMLWAVENGITNGMSATTFEPGRICTRAQVVTFLYRAFAE